MATRLPRGTAIRVGLAVLLSVVLLAASLGFLAASTLQGGPETAQRDPGAANVEELGRLLFFDQRLSGDASMSCATCHAPDKAWADGIGLSRGYSRSTLYFRNTPSLLNAAAMPLLDWDGRFGGGDMSSLIRDHLAEAHFMNIDGRLLVERLRQVPEYEDRFRELYGSDVSYGKVLHAVASFVETLRSVDHPYLRHLSGNTGALTVEAEAGLALFQGKAGCAQCHGGELLADGELHALGVPENPAIFQEPMRHITFRRFFRAFGVSDYVTMREDPGLFALTFDEADRGKFRTPSLLEVARTAPYMHNGTFESLEDVVRFYNRGGGDIVDGGRTLRPLGLTDGEIVSIVAFLESLGSTEVPVEAPPLPAYEPRTLGAN